MKSYMATAYTVPTLRVKQGMRVKLIQTTIWYKSPNKLRMEATGQGRFPCHSLTVVNGAVERQEWPGDSWFKCTETIDWNKLSRWKKGKRHFMLAGTDIVHPFRGMKKVKLLGKVIHDREECYLFEGEPLWRSGGIERWAGHAIGAKAKLWVGMKDGLLRRVLLSDSNGNETFWQTYKDLKLNIQISNDKFTDSSETVWFSESS